MAGRDGGVRRQAERRTGQGDWQATAALVSVEIVGSQLKADFGRCPAGRGSWWSEQRGGCSYHVREARAAAAVGEQRFLGRKIAGEGPHRVRGEGDVVEGQGQACDWPAAGPARRVAPKTRDWAGHKSGHGWALSTGAANRWSASSWPCRSRTDCPWESAACSERAECSRQYGDLRRRSSEAEEAEGERAS